MMELEYCPDCVTVIGRAQNMMALGSMIDHTWVWHVVCGRKVIAGGSSVCSSIAEEEARKASVLYHGVKFKIDIK